MKGFPADGNGNFSEFTDPRFVDPRSTSEAPTTAGDYRLLPDSPFIDAGSNAASTSTLDLDGNVRVQDGNNDGTATIDVGSYEFIPTGEPAKITAIAYNENTGQVTLTVESTASMSYSVEYSTSMATGTWNPGPSGTLSIGTNTIQLPENTYNGPQLRTFLRLTFP